MFHGYKTDLFRTGTKMTAFMLGILIAVMSSATAVYADTHREFEYTFKFHIDNCNER